MQLETDNHNDKPVGSILAKGNMSDDQKVLKDENIGSNKNLDSVDDKKRKHSRRTEKVNSDYPVKRLSIKKDAISNLLKGTVRARDKMDREEKKAADLMYENLMRKVSEKSNITEENNTIVLP